MGHCIEWVNGEDTRLTDILGESEVMGVCQSRMWRFGDHLASHVMTLCDAMEKVG